MGEPVLWALNRLINKCSFVHSVYKSSCVDLFTFYQCYWLFVYLNYHISDTYDMGHIRGVDIPFSLAQWWFFITALLWIFLWFLFKQISILKCCEYFFDLYLSKYQTYSVVNISFYFSKYQYILLLEVAYFSLISILSTITHISLFYSLCSMFAVFYSGVFYIPKSSVPTLVMQHQWQ